MPDPLVSILIPCYNSAKYIKQAVDSCLNQDWKNIEVIIVDDGSTDDSINIIRSIRDKRVQIVNQKNSGTSAARNSAYKLSKGKYVQYLDSDDFLSADKISNQVKILENEKPGYVSISNTLYFYDGQNPENGRLKSDWPHVDTDNPTEWLIELLGPETGSMIQTGAWLTPRIITDKIGLWDLSICPTPIDDGEYFSRVVLASTGIRKSSSGVNFYRQYRHQRSLSAQKTTAYAWGHYRSLKKIESNLFASQSDQKAKKAFARLYKDLAYRAYPASPDVTEACLQRANELGFGKFNPIFPTKIGRVLSAVVGWRLMKKLNYVYHLLRKT
jgi:glycosyltransferase involved in cell wall biosynthesis